MTKVGEKKIFHHTLQWNFLLPLASHKDQKREKQRQYAKFFISDKE